MNLLSTEGRLKRTDFALSLFGILLVAFLIDRFIIPTPTLDYTATYRDSYDEGLKTSQIWKGIVALIAYFLIWVQCIKRLQDIGKSGWYSCFFMLPPFLIPILMFIDYSSSTGLLLSNIVTVLFFLLSVIGVLGILYTLFAAGEETSNKYGDNPRNVDKVDITT